MNLRVCLAFSALTISLACGGGGGSGVAMGSALVYTTDWTGASLPSGGLSQRLILSTPDGMTVRTLDIEKRASGVDTYRVDGLAAGTYDLDIELYRDPLRQGGLSGIVHARVNISAEATFRSLVGAPVASLSIEPPSANLEVPEGLRFYAVAKDAGGSTTFVSPQSLQWQITGGVGTIAVQGICIAQNPGNATVRVTHLPTQKGATATVNVKGAQTRQAKWTILVYLNSANDLYSYSRSNINQMEHVASNPDVRFIVQWKQARTQYPGALFDGTRRYLVQPDGTDAIASRRIQDLGKGTDMGRPETLAAFIAWAKTYYPAQRYGLIVWSHGNGWRRRPDVTTRAVSYDDETGNAIQVWELSQALGANQFDFLAWDASLMQMMEVAYEVKDHAKFVVGSEESPPAEGYPYDGVFAGFRDRPDDPTPGLVQSFVDATLAVPQYSTRKITQSVIDTSRLPALESSIDALTQQLMTNHTALGPAIQQVRQEAQGYSQTSVRYYRDLDDLCARLSTLTSLPGVKAACSDVRSKLADAVLLEGHNAQSPGSRGLSIDLTPGSVFLANSNDYARLKFGRDNLWDDWLASTP